MVVIIVLTALGGVELDKLPAQNRYSRSFSLLGVVAAMWLIIKEAVRNK
jgi:hypothetical protein